MSNNQLVTLDGYSIAQVMQGISEVANSNHSSREKCIAYGQELLDSIKQNGMTEELDSQVAAYLAKTRKTLSVMNERRVPVTQTMDKVRSYFTNLENSIDAKKADTIPYTLQGYRNSYAAQKLREEEACKRAEAERIAKASAKTEYLEYLLFNFKKGVSEYLINEGYRFQNLFHNVDIETYEETYNVFSELKTEYNNEDCITLLRGLYFSPFAKLNLLTNEEHSAIRTQAQKEFFPDMKAMLTAKFSELKDYYLLVLPNRKKELEKIYQASEVEVEKLKKEAEDRIKLEQQKVEEEAALARQKTEQEAALARQNSELRAAFVTAANTTAANVKKKHKIEILSSDAILPIIQKWYTEEGCNTDLESLCKKFKFAISYCEKQADKKGQFLQHKDIVYTELITAK